MWVGKRPLDKRGQLCAGCSLRSWQVCSSLFTHNQQFSLCCCSLRAEPGAGRARSGQSPEQAEPSSRRLRARSRHRQRLGEPGLSWRHSRGDLCFLYAGRRMAVCSFGQLQDKFPSSNTCVGWQFEEWCPPAKSRTCPSHPKWWSSFVTRCELKTNQPNRTGSGPAAETSWTLARVLKLYSL